MPSVDDTDVHIILEHRLAALARLSSPNGVEHDAKKCQRYDTSEHSDTPEIRSHSASSLSIHWVIDITHVRYAATCAVDQCAILTLE